MTVPKFKFLSPSTADEVCDLLKIHGQKAMLMVGGTDLLIKIKARRIQPEYVIGLKKVTALGGLNFDISKGLTVGAIDLLVSVAANSDVRKYYPALACGARETATVQIRNMGSVVANICNSSPSADTAPSAVALDAVVNIKSHLRERQLPIVDFLKGPGQIALDSDEFVTSIFFPVPAANSGNSYQHISARSKVDIPAACVAASITVRNDRITDVKIALGAVGPTVFRATKTESLLKGQRVGDMFWEAAATTAADEASPISDMRASADYRRKMIAVLTKRAVREAIDRAQNT